MKVNIRTTQNIKLAYLIANKQTLAIYQHKHYTVKGQLYFSVATSIKMLQKFIKKIYNN